MKNLRTVGLLSLLVVAPSLFAVKGERSTLSKLATGTTLGAIATLGGRTIHNTVIPNVVTYITGAKVGIPAGYLKTIKTVGYALQAANLVATVACTNAAARDMDKQDSDETRVNVRRTTIASAALTLAGLYFDKI